MKTILRITTVTALVTALAPFAGHASAAGMVTVKGTAPQGYSILMVGKTGNSVAVGSGKFALKMTAAAAKGATLHLVSSAGAYGGPVMLKVNKSAKTGNTQLSGKSGDLGKIAMKTGYSIAAAKSTTAIATTSKIGVSAAGAPSGAGRMGLPDKTSGASVKVFGVQQLGDGDAPKGEDTDKDGLPNTLDIDDDNDGKIDMVDDTNPSKAVTTGSLLFLDISKTINLNAGMDQTSMQTALDAVFASNNNVFIGLAINMQSAGKNFDGAHMSCATEVKWCAPGTPATLSGAGNFNSAPETWVSKMSDGFALGLPFGGAPNCDATGGSPVGNNNSCGGHTGVNRQIIPKLPTADVQPGSLFTVNFTIGGKIDTAVTGSLSPYFVSVPALKEVQVGSTVIPIDYSKKSLNGTAASAGTEGNPIPLGADKMLTLRFWRPQRSGVATAGEAKYLDMGGLRYGFYSNIQSPCPAESYSGLSKSLTASPASDFNHVPLVDSSTDAVPAATNFMEFTIDASKCWNPGSNPMNNKIAMLTLISSSAGSFSNRAYQDFWVKLP